MNFQNKLKYFLRAFAESFFAQITTFTLSLPDNYLRGEMPVKEKVIIVEMHINTRIFSWLNTGLLDRDLIVAHEKKAFDVFSRAKMFYKQCLPEFVNMHYLYLFLINIYHKIFLVLFSM